MCGYAQGFLLTGADAGSETSGVPMWSDEWSAMSAWCVDALGAPPVRELFGHARASQVVGVELADGRSVVFKRRRDENGRTATCVAVQLALSQQGFRCARPLTPVSIVHGYALHAEELMAGGDIRRGDDPATGAAFGMLYARTLAAVARLTVPAPLPNPAWVRWGEDLAFPRLWWQPDWVATAPMPVIIDDVACRLRRRLTGSALPLVLGHADWETQNIRWDGEAPYVEHDWDSLAALPEAALVGVASGAFANHEVPTLAPVDSSAAFLDAYQCGRGRTFTRAETETAWAASLWPAVYNARTQLMYDRPAVALWAVEEQSEERLRRASA